MVNKNDFRAKRGGLIGLVAPEFGVPVEDATGTHYDLWEDTGENKLPSPREIYQRMREKR